MSLVYPGRITRIEIGLSALVNCDITNVVLFNWERMHDVRPRLIASQKLPLDTYNQPHSWVIGSFSLLSDERTCIYATDVQAAAGDQFAYADCGDSYVIDWFVVYYEDAQGLPFKSEVTSGIIYRAVKELLNYDDSVWIYHFMAACVEDSPA